MASPPPLQHHVFDPFTKRYYHVGPRPGPTTIVPNHTFDPITRTFQLNPQTCSVVESERVNNNNNNPLKKRLKHETTYKVQPSSPRSIHANRLVPTLLHRQFMPTYSLATHRMLSNGIVQRDFGERLKVHHDSFLSHIISGPEMSYISDYRTLVIYGSRSLTYAKLQDQSPTDFGTWGMLNATDQTFDVLARTATDVLAFTSARHTDFPRSKLSRLILDSMETVVLTQLQLPFILSTSWSDLSPDRNDKRSAQCWLLTNRGNKGVILDSEFLLAGSVDKFDSDAFSCAASQSLIMAGLRKGQVISWDPRASQKHRREIINCTGPITSLQLGVGGDGSDHFLLVLAPDVSGPSAFVYDVRMSTYPVVAMDEVRCKVSARKPIVVVPNTRPLGGFYLICDELVGPHRSPYRTVFDETGSFVTTIPQVPVGQPMAVMCNTDQHTAWAIISHVPGRPSSWASYTC